MGQQAYRGVLQPCDKEKCLPLSASCAPEIIDCHTECGGKCSPFAAEKLYTNPDFDEDEFSYVGIAGISIVTREREKRPKQHLKDGSTYDGQWCHSSRDGHGKQELSNGARYEGQWLDDRYHGAGTYSKDGKIYSGEWQNGRAHGHGSLTHADGSVYDGEWRHDQQHGRGMEEWTDGSKFVGQYQDGLKTGEGVFSWPDGTRYEGQMFKNALSGNGTYTRSDKRKYKGQWVNNKMEGRGIFTWKDGKMYDGEYKNDLKHGSGVFVYADGRRYDGQWELGKQHGIGLWHEPEQDGQGIGRKGKWKKGKFVKWLSEGDEQSFSHISTSCSTMSSLDLSSLLSNSVPSDMTGENSENSAEDYPLYISSNQASLASPKVSRKDKKGLAPPSDVKKNKFFGKKLSSLFQESEKDLKLGK
jgi:hypothetical protein